MKFKDFYPYKKERELFTFSIANVIAKIVKARTLDRHVTAEKGEVKNLFSQLKEIEDDPENLLEKKEEIIGRCDGIINRQLLLQGEISKVIILSSFAVKMEIYDRLNESDEVRRNYGNFLRVKGAVDVEGQEIPNHFQRYVNYGSVYAARELERNLARHLIPVLVIKNGKNLQEMSVPEILSSASYSPRNYDNKKIKRVFCELWNVESLQPLLTTMAQATQGYYCDYKGEVRQGKKLQIFFSDNDFKGAIGLAAKNSISISLSEKSEHGDDYVLRNIDLLKGVVTHELHHYWESSRYNNSSSPYTKVYQAKTLPIYPEEVGQYLWQNFSDTKKAEKILAKESKAHVTQMLKEAYDIKRENCDNNLGSELFEIFKNLESYSESRNIRRKEVVVRTSEALATMSGSKGRSEEKVFEILDQCGLVKCVEFFHKEREQMQEAAEKIALESQVSFAPMVLVHDVIKNQSDELTTQLLKKYPYLLTYRDSLGQTLLESMASNNNHRLILDLFKETKMQYPLFFDERDSEPLRQVVFYLIDLAKDETSEFADEARGLFKEIKYLNNLVGKSYSFKSVNYDARKATLSEELLNKVKSKTPEEILTAIDQGEIAIRDKFGNIFFEYVFEVSKRDPDAKKIRKDIFDKVREKYDHYELQVEDLFLPANPLRSAFCCNQPKIFLENFQKSEDASEILQQRLGIVDAKNDSVIELIAESCGFGNGGGKWFDIFKNIICEHEIDPNQKYGASDKTLLDLLPEDFREEAQDVFVKVVTAEVTKSLEEITQNVVETNDPRTNCEIIETVKVSSDNAVSRKY